mgnify:FL=1
MESIIFSISPRTIVTIGSVTPENIEMFLEYSPRNSVIQAYHTGRDKMLINLQERFKDFHRVSVESADKNTLDNIIMGNADIIHSNVEINPSKFLNLLSHKGVIILEGSAPVSPGSNMITVGNLTIIKE